MTAREAVRRVALREYLPWGGLIVTWVMIALAVGPADAARLFAAAGFVRSARNLTLASVFVPVRQRVAQDGRLTRQVRRVAAGVELLAWLAGLLALGAVLVLLIAAGQQRVAVLAAILALGLPPRYLLPLAANRNVGQVFRPSVAWIGAALVALAWLLDAGLTALALALVAREWIAFFLSLVTAPAALRDRPPLGPLHWRDIAAYSATAARRRLSYRLTKGALTAVLGPVGGAAARAGREFRLHRRLHRFTPQEPLPLLLLGAATGLSGLLLILAAPSPATLVIAASLFMVAAVAGNVLIWSAFQTDMATTDDDEDDEVS